MPNVLNEYVGDGSTKSFTFAMAGGYLSRDYVQFYVRPAEDLLAFSPLTGNPVTWTGPFSFTLANPIPVGTVLAVMRETPLEPLVDFQNTSRITEKNLDTGIHQPMHKVAELSDLVGRINTVAGDAQDVANSSVETSTEALATANAANAAAAAATNTANGATATANGAVDTANAAAATASNAKSTADTALTQAGQANTKATAAVATANAASNAADNAVGVAGNASSTASQALTRATNAFNAADSALTTANAAATSANAASNAASASAASANTAKNDAQAAASAAATAQSDAADAKSTAISAAAQSGTAASTATAADNKATEALGKANTAIADAGTALANSNTAAADAASARVTAEAALELVEDATSGAVSSFNGRSGSVVPQAGDYNKAMVGLANVDNTSDADKPVSTATAAALAQKAGAADLAALSTSIQESLNPRITVVENATAANATAIESKAPKGHTHKIADITDFDPGNYMPKAGGTFTGSVSFNGLSTNTVGSLGVSAITYTAQKHIFNGQVEASFKGNLTGNVTGNVTGAATSAGTAESIPTRTLTIGSASRTFDGTQNVSWSLSDIGAVSRSAAGDVSGLLSVNSAPFAQNLIINGCMDIRHQASSGPIPTDASSIQTSDLFGCFSTGGGTAVSETLTRASAGFSADMRVNYVLRVRATSNHTLSGGTALGIRYSVEGHDTRLLFGTTFTLSFWCRAARAGNITVALRNAARNRVYLSNVTINAANTWERKSITLSGGIDAALSTYFDTMTGEGLSLVWTLNGGAQFQAAANTWVGTDSLVTSSQSRMLMGSGDYFDITGVQLEPGAVATSLVIPTIAETQRKVNRYIRGGIAGWLCSNGGGSFGGDVLNIMFEAMRTTPTVLAWYAVPGTVTGSPTVQAASPIGVSIGMSGNQPLAAYAQVGYFANASFF